MLSIFARPRPLNRFVLGCHMIVTRSYVRKLEFCNLIGAFTFQYAAILLDQEILRKSPDPFPGGRGLGTRLAFDLPFCPGCKQYGRSRDNNVRILSVDRLLYLSLIDVTSSVSFWGSREGQHQRHCASETRA